MTKPIRRTALLPLFPASADAGPFDCKDAVIALELRRAEEPGFSTDKPGTEALTGRDLTLLPDRFMELARPNAVGRWKHRLQKLRVSDRTLPRPDLLKLMQKYQ